MRIFKNDNDNWWTFWRLAKKHNLETPDIINIFALQPGPTSVDEYAERVGWPEMVMRLRLHLDKLKHDEEIRETFTKEQLEDDLNNPGDISYLYPDDKFRGNFS